MKKKPGSDMHGYIQNPGHLIVEKELTMQWEPIESAPKDGTRILVYCKEWRQTYAVLWKKTLKFGGEEGPEDWCLDYQGAIGITAPTHWMPIIEPPKED